ncbi:MAG: hypothetical protein M1820_002140 [Bogoriella megaspora]|nr:MAG: hypothetical protein M1820_002140 [Bogoriella megaspora]
MAVLDFCMVACLGGWWLYTCYRLYLNYNKASKLGIPCIVVLFSPDSPLWIALQTTFSSLFRYLPLDTFSFTRYCSFGWEFRDRYETHDRLGDAWILVTPVRNWLFVADTQAIVDVFSRGRDFINPAWMLEPLAIFGPSISTAEGKDWQRQRKLTATPFNEQKSVLVWQESLRQASDMLNTWCSHGSNGFTTTSDDTRTLALHVLAYVAFQKSYPFGSKSKTEVTSAESMTYRDAIAIILKNIFLILVFPASIFTLPGVPTSWKRIGWAVQYFRTYMLQQVHDEQQLVRNGQSGTGTLISNLVRASNEAAREDSMIKPLSEAEILGNMFVFNFAGHDTTAISLAYAMVLLSAHPEVQDWVHEEIRQYVQDGDLLNLEYDNIFPKLKRCVAVLYETLRLYSPLPGVPKYTGNQPSHLSVQSQSYLVPADTLIIPNLQTVQTHPQYWGNDSLVWRPQRWISGSRAKGNLESEVLLDPPKGTYFPWSEGIRNCPGKRFAQVEFVAVMVALFTDHVSEPVPKANETLTEARRRALDVVKDSHVELLLQMRAPESLSISWKKR